MPDDEGMTIAERRKYLRRMQARYGAADRTGRGRLLDEMECVTGLHRRSLVRLLAPHGPGLARRVRTTQRGKTYGAAVDDALRVLWETLDFCCAERLQPALVPLARRLAQHGELRLTAEVETPVGPISRASVPRRLTRFRALGQDVAQGAEDGTRWPSLAQLPRSGPERANRANALARQIPMRRIAWDEAEPGHGEVDLVHHSGDRTAGEYVHTLQVVDVATGWSERVAVYGRSYRAMEAAFRRVVERVPFPIRELHPDTGPACLNHQLVRFWGEAITGLTLSRSRP